MRVYRDVSEPPREGLSWDQRWEGPDRGLIACWERGRTKRLEDPELAAKASLDELVVLPWKGGVEKPIKGGKYGSYLYLAMFQGLRGEPLDIDPSADTSRTCSRTQVTVTYTSDRSKFANSVE